MNADSLFLGHWRASLPCRSADRPWFYFGRAGVRPCKRPPRSPHQTRPQAESLMSDIRVDHDELFRFFVAVFTAKGMRPADAETLAEMLVWANLRGVDSHGAMRVPDYMNQIKKGTFDPAAQPQLRPLMPATFMIECARAAGPVCMMLAAAHAIERAETFGVGVGLLSDTAHTGAVGRYAHWIAERGFAAIVMVAGPPFMAYHGAKVTSLGTSPIAIGIPGPEERDPLVLDMATSMTAAGSHPPGGRGRRSRSAKALAIDADQDVRPPIPPRPRRCCRSAGQRGQACRCCSNASPASWPAHRSSPRLRVLPDRACRCRTRW